MSKGTLVDENAIGQTSGEFVNLDAGVKTGK